MFGELEHEYLEQEVERLNTLVNQLLNENRAVLAELARRDERLRDVRDSCASNLDNPGNEDDTFEWIIDSVTSTLNDDYEYNHPYEDE